MICCVVLYYLLRPLKTVFYESLKKSSNVCRRTIRGSLLLPPLSLFCDCDCATTGTDDDDDKDDDIGTSDTRERAHPTWRRNSNPLSRSSA